MQTRDLKKEVKLVSVFLPKEKELSGKELLRRARKQKLLMTEDQFQLLVENIKFFPEEWEQFVLFCAGIDMITGDDLPGVACFIQRDGQCYLRSEWVGAPFPKNTRMLKFKQ